MTGLRKRKRKRKRPSPGTGKRGGEKLDRGKGPGPIRTGRRRPSRRSPSKLVVVEDHGIKEMSEGMKERRR